MGDMKSWSKIAIALVAAASVPAASLVDQPPPHAEASTPAPASVVRAAPVEAAAVPTRAARDVVASAKLRPNPHPTYRAGKLIEVRLDRQRLVAWKDGEKIRTLVISTGMPGWDTPDGTFKIYAKVESGYSRPWDVVLPWMLAFSGNYTLHQVTHPPGDPDRIYGRDQLGTPASHGCIRVDLGDAEWLYRFARVGTPVWIH